MSHSDPDPEDRSRALRLAKWFAEEVQPHEGALRSWLRVRFTMLADIDDLVQEAYSRLLRVRETGSVANPRAFLFVTARNLALNQLRHERHARGVGMDEADAHAVLDDGPPVAEAVAHAEDLQLLIQAIKGLPDRCRQVMTLRKIYGLSQGETARRLGISEHTVEAQGAIGLRKCVEFFRRRGYRPRS